MQRYSFFCEMVRGKGKKLLKVPQNTKNPLQCRVGWLQGIHLISVLHYGLPPPNPPPGRPPGNPPPGAPPGPNPPGLPGPPG